MSETSPAATIASLRDLIPLCMSGDQHRFRRKLVECKRLPVEAQQKSLTVLQSAIETSCALRERRANNRPTIDYPNLPVSDRREDIAKAIEENQVVIIAGETGSGKTTQIPKICLDLGRGVSGLIGHTQPRRLAARSVANRIAEELSSPLGEQVGFKIRFSDQVSEQSYIKLMTDGILLAEIQKDRFLNQYDTIIIDEAHERSLNIDFILGYLKQLLPKRPDLKLIVTSATIDPERFSRHFNNAPVLQVSGRTYPVEIRYRPMEEQEQGTEQSQAICDAVAELQREGPGDILVFLSGEREIRDTAEVLQRAKFRNTDILPLYARLSAAEQNRIFQSHVNRRVVLATNVAETSLTVPGIKYVIDPGTARISRYSVRSKVQRLPIEPVSQASANQRAGRCGRVSEGICVRLYSEEDYLNRAEFTDPEILRTNLASVIIQMLSLGLGKIDQFPFVQPPDQRNINDGFRLLEELGAIDKQHSRLQLTPMGRQVARLPIDPRYARMIVEAARMDCLNEVLVIAAGLSIQDPRERPQDKRQAADEAHNEYADEGSDFITFWNLWQLFKQRQAQLSASQLRKWCRQQFINYLRMREWQDIVSQLKKSVSELGFRLTQNPADYSAVHTAIASGLLSHLGFKDKDREYLGARNSRFVIFPGSKVAKKPPKWTMVAELVETSRLYGRVAAKIDPQWVEPLAKHLSNYQYSEPYWSKKQGAVMATEKVLLFGLAIVPQRRVNYTNIDPVVSQQLFIQEALVNGDTKLNFDFLANNQQQIAAIEALEDKSRRRDLLVDETTLIEFYQQHIPAHVCSEASFAKWWRKQSQQTPSLLDFDPQALLKQSTDHVTAASFPDVWRQGNLTLPLSYHFDPKDMDDGVSLVIPLPLLNQVEDRGFDWLIPGLQTELLVTLIKSLPKRLRRNFVPAPDFASACLAELDGAALQAEGQGFLDAVSHKLFRMTGVKVALEDWQTDGLPAHLTFNFKVVGDDGQTLAQGRDLGKLKTQLQGEIASTLSEVATPELEQSGLTEWDFPSLPEEFVNQTAGFEVKAYPALVEEKSSVAIRLFDQPEQAAQAHRQGVRKLVRLNIPSPVKYLQQKLPNKAKLGLYFNPFGRVDRLIDDCIDAGIDLLQQRFIAEQGADIREAEQFTQLVEVVRQDINEVVLDIAASVERGLTRAHAVQKKMKGNVPLNMISAHGDIKSHLDSLVFDGFVTALGADKLDDWNRYIEGIERRLEKLPIDPSKDRLHQINIDKVAQEYQRALNKIPSGSRVPPALEEVRWMLEELRISFFAQQLGTRMPISAKRIQNHLQGI